jgi:hypothetical protein
MPVAPPVINTVLPDIFMKTSTGINSMGRMRGRECTPIPRGCKEGVTGID